MNKQQASSNFLRALADALEHLTREEFEALLAAGEIKSLIRTSTRSRQGPKPSENRSDIKRQADELMLELVTMNSRDQARNYFEEHRLSRRVLIEAAKVRSIHVAREDTVSTLIEKLIANTVGSRLDSAAIRSG